MGPSDLLSSLVLDRVALPKTDSVHNLGVILDLQFLVKNRWQLWLRESCTASYCVSVVPFSGFCAQSLIP